MKEKELKTYCVPECRMVHVETSSLLDTSFPGQHNPGQHGTGPSCAKQGWIWQDEEEDEYGLFSWED